MLFPLPCKINKSRSNSLNRQQEQNLSHGRGRRLCQLWRQRKPFPKTVPELYCTYAPLAVLQHDSRSFALTQFLSREKIFFFFSFYQNRFCLFLLRNQPHTLALCVCLHQLIWFVFAMHSCHHCHYALNLFHFLLQPG